MAWTNAVGRSLDREIINLAFSGNGQLEKPLLDLIAEEDAAVYVLDCLPNLAIGPKRNEKQLDSLTVAAVKIIRMKHPKTPIVLTGHSSAFTPGFMNKGVLVEYEQSTEVGKATFGRLRKEGDKNLYWLDSRDIGLDINSTVDYAHPNDYGMDKIAKAYIQLLNKILK
jgi:lysophospholipase L1-like esterase